MKKIAIYKHGILTITDYSKNSVWIDVENEGGSAAIAMPLGKIRNLVNEFPPIKPSRIEVQLFDALENMVSELYADGPSRRGEDRANRCLAAFAKKYGDRHDGKWRQ